MATSFICFGSTERAVGQRRDHLPRIAELVAYRSLGARGIAAEDRVDNLLVLVERTPAGPLGDELEDGEPIDRQLQRLDDAPEPRVAGELGYEHVKPRVLEHVLRDGVL